MSESVSNETRVLVMLFADTVEKADQPVAGLISTQLGNRIFDLSPAVKNRVIADLLVLNHELSGALTVAELPVVDG